MSEEGDLRITAGSSTVPQAKDNHALKLMVSTGTAGRTDWFLKMLLNSYYR